MKNRLRVVTVPADREEELLKHKPRVISRTLGFVSAILDASIEIEGANYSRPSLADIFLATVGGTNESV